MNYNDITKTNLLGKTVDKIHNSVNIFLRNRIHCPFVDNVMDRCDNEDNPTVFCDWENCPLGEE